MRRLPFGKVMHFRRPVLHPPFVERPAADAQIGAHLRNGELVPLSAVADLVSAGHDGASQPPWRADCLGLAAEATGTPACSWLLLPAVGSGDAGIPRGRAS